MTKRLLIFIWFLLFPMYAFSFWTNLTPGIDYHVEKQASGSIHLFKISLKNHELKFASTKTELLPVSNVAWTAEKYNARLAINSGFFTPDWKPIGLRIQNGKTMTPLKSTAWWPVFYIQDNKAYVVSETDFIKNPNMAFAIQSGPRLLKENKVTVKNPGHLDERTALGINANGDVIIIVTELNAMTLKTFAEYLAKSEAQGGPACIEAINLDGGTSTQVATNFPKLHLAVGYFLVADIIYVA